MLFFLRSFVSFFSFLSDFVQISGYFCYCSISVFLSVMCIQMEFHYLKFTTWNICEICKCVFIWMKHLRASKGHVMECDWVEIRHMNQTFVVYLCFDLGWLKTFDDYFREMTQYIFNNMVIKLKEDSRRKFMWSEISYLSKWWDTIDKPKKDAVKRFVSRFFFFCNLVILINYTVKHVLNF